MSGFISLYDYLISYGYSKDIASDLQMKYSLGGSITREELKIFSDYDNFRKAK